MNYVVIVFFVIFLSCHTIYCQETSKKNLVFFEAAGVSYNGVALGYGRYFRLSRILRASVRGGIAIAGERQSFAPFLGGSILLGKRSNLELGYNVLFQYENIETETIYEYPSNDENGLPEIIQSEKIAYEQLGHFLLGYRWQSKKSGFMFRIFVTSPTQLSIWGYPGGGISVGVAF